MMRRRTKTSPTVYSDLALVKRAGRIAALQASVALALILLIVGGIVFAVYVRAQNREIDGELRAVAVTADDANDPPPNMELVLRDNDGKVTMSPGGRSGLPLLAGPAGFTDVNDDVRYRVLVLDRTEGRVVAMTAMEPYRVGRNHLLIAIGLAESAGIFASLVVVAVFSRRSARPLAQALTLQRRFVADASHELRAPLTVLHTRAQLLLHRTRSAAMGEAVQAEAEALVADTRALGDIVEDLLASVTMSSGTPVHDRVDLAAVASSVCDSMVPYARELGVELSFVGEKTSSPTSFVVLGSEAALRRVFTSLVDNALAHSKDAGRVEIQVRRAGSNVVATVTDDGTGINPQVLQTLFSRFSHGSAPESSATRRRYGIGLALVREIVQGLGGEIAVSSTLGQGAKFTITIPAAPKPSYQGS
jgi:signal transduction histidine kinase